MKTSTHSLIQHYYEYFNQGDIPAFLNLLNEDIVHDINQGETEIGRQAFATFMDRMDTAYQEHIEDLTIMTTPDGDRAAAEFTVIGTYKKTDYNLPTAKNQSYSLRCGAFFEIKNGKISRVTNYYNLNDWLKQIKE
ncbi:ketosteroid isomerase-related protein [Candidatus Berkiella aquae]|uniref:Nuclear transport factor 2 family protein n=1 Tax=Candidatus Berkiella aquae TaxID=295108 RepID=A0A0Q9YLT9_9GAMM|nr:ketosteroid isomerase-related protein [Candidatus Berkiella aquae]MCS5710604.1 nuclear transport factor 2 family protein [Candidatus Berkiella aquae]